MMNPNMTVSSKNISLDDIHGLLDTLATLESHFENIDTLRQQEIIDAVPNEHATIIKEIGTKYSIQKPTLEKEIDDLRNNIRMLALESGHTNAETSNYKLQERKARVKWDTAGLLGYAKARREVLEFRLPGPTKFVAIRKKA